MIDRAEDSLDNEGAGTRGHRQQSGKEGGHVDARDGLVTVRVEEAKANCKREGEGGEGEEEEEAQEDALCHQGHDKTAAAPIPPMGRGCRGKLGEMPGKESEANMRERVLNPAKHAPTLATARSAVRHLCRSARGLTPLGLRHRLRNRSRSPRYLSRASRSGSPTPVPSMRPSLDVPSTKEHSLLPSPPLPVATWDAVAAVEAEFVFGAAEAALARPA